ncbi:MAG: hypothetical protein IIC60_02680 [Proteobacteria bacterium]|nr:hypothetical protein [Pseudomonadota bacterium]
MLESILRQSLVVKGLKPDFWIVFTACWLVEVAIEMLDGILDTPMHLTSV